MSLPKGIVITNSDGNTYVTGTRGRKPAWVESHPDYLKLVNESPVVETTKEVKLNDEGLLFWKWNGGNVRCIVAALSSLAAIRLLSKRFTHFPVSGNEFNALWKRTEALEDVKDAGVYELKDNAWVCTAA
jgi:hypothetical protein